MTSIDSMTLLKKLYYCTLMIIAHATMVKAQSIWPGDVNNNGIVNGVDLLYVGLGYGETGPIRLNADNDWEEQIITIPWAQFFSNGINYAYADCNGDGTIDDTDIEEVIVENFYQTHLPRLSDGFENGQVGVSPQIRLEPVSNDILAGTELEVKVILGTSNLPVKDFFGVTFQLSFNADLVDESDDFLFELSPTAWVDPSGGAQSRSVLFVDETTGKAEMALTRIDGQTIPTGSGEIGSFRIIIEDIVVGRQIDTFHLQIDSIKLIDKDFNTFPTAPDTASVIVRSMAVGTTSAPVTVLRVYPNPTQQLLHIETPGHAIDQLFLYNPQGQLITKTPHTMRNTGVQLNMSSEPPGLYLLRISANNRWFTEKLLLTNNRP